MTLFWAAFALSMLSIPAKPVGMMSSCAITGTCRLGSQCTADEHCVGSADCTNGRCVKTSSFVLPGLRCDLNARRCTPGFTCMRRGSDNFCSKVVGIGGLCGYPGLFCDTELRCIGERCSNRDGERVLGEYCDDVAPCVHGLACIGTPGRKRCVTFYRVLNYCNPPWWMCSAGRKCVDHRCMLVPGGLKKAGILPLHGSCSRPGWVCGPRLKCFQGSCIREDDAVVAL